MMQFGIGQSQHVRRPARGHEISAGLGGVLREGVGQACGAPVQRASIQSQG